MPTPTDPMQRLDAYWRAANYLSVGQIYLLANPLLREPFRIEHVKPRLLGHWGTTPGLNLIHAHLNRIIRARDLDMIYVIGPGHGGPAAVASAYLEGTYSEIDPDVSRDEAGMARLFRQFSSRGACRAMSRRRRRGRSTKASSDRGVEPDVVMACAGVVPTLETLAAVDLLRELAPELKVRVVNVVDLMRLVPSSEHPHGLSDRDFDGIFTTDRPIIFAFHGHPWLIHRLTYRRTNHHNLHVRGDKEEGTTTTPFDMTVRNDLDRFHLVADTAARVPKLAARAPHLRQAMEERVIERKAYICRYGDDMPAIRSWTWRG